MKKAILVLLLVCAGAVSVASAASPTTVIETLPYSNELNPVVTCSTASTSAVAISSSVITVIDTVFNAAASAACGATYSRAELTVQNNGAVNVYCGYSAGGLTIANSFALTPGSVWTWKLGKGISPYCLNAAGSAGTLIVGGVAWK